MTQTRDCNYALEDMLKTKGALGPHSPNTMAHRGHSGLWAYSRSLACPNSLVREADIADVYL